MGQFAVWRVRGLSEVDAVMRQMNEATRARVLGVALLAGGKVLLTGMERRQPHRTGRGQLVLVADPPRDGAAALHIGPDRHSFALGILEVGAKPHVIKPRVVRLRRKLATFVARNPDRLREALNAIRVSPGVLASKERIFGRVVRHPGVHEYRFMRGTLESDGPRSTAAVRDAFWAELERIAAAAPKVS